MSSVTNGAKQTGAVEKKTYRDKVVEKTDNTKETPKASAVSEPEETRTVWADSPSLVEKIAIPLSRNSAESHTPRSRPRTVIFLLNRNGLAADELRETIDKMLEDKYAAPDAKVYWLSIFGKLPERPHAFLTLTDEEVASELIADEKIKFTLDEKEFMFEVSQAFGLPAKEFEDQNCIFVCGVPSTKSQQATETELKQFFGGVATPDTIIFPREWEEKGNIILRFEDIECAQMVARTSLFCTFNDTLLKCSYARKQIQREPPKGRK
jgi:hypothetical protein